MMRKLNFLLVIKIYSVIKKIIVLYLKLVCRKKFLNKEILLVVGMSKYK